MSAQHTPGPWKASHEFAGATDCGYDIGPQLADDDFSYRGSIARVIDAEHIKGIEKPERDANARLIAAAPDLLEALTILADHCERMGFNTREEEPLLEAARAAIAKATGATS